MMTKIIDVTNWSVLKLFRRIQWYRNRNFEYEVVPQWSENRIYMFVDRVKNDT